MSRRHRVALREVPWLDAVTVPVVAMAAEAVVAMAAEAVAVMVLPPDAALAGDEAGVVLHRPRRDRSCRRTAASRPR